MACKLTITDHARWRWVERGVNSRRYYHLRNCKINCHICRELNYEINNILRFDYRRINKQIADRTLSVIENDQKLTDNLFLDIIQKYYPTTNKRDYYEDSQFVYVIGNNKSVPALVTLLTRDMLDNTIIQYSSSRPAMKSVFNAWKFQKRMQSV